MDALDRPWQLGTLQCDFNMPEAFGLKYTGEDNQEHRPVMLHRAILGSLERFIGVYLEHTAGRLPLWLAPVQVKILDVKTEESEYSQQIYEDLKEVGVRVQWDNRGRAIGIENSTRPIRKGSLPTGHRRQRAAEWYSASEVF